MNNLKPLLKGCMAGKKRDTTAGSTCQKRISTPVVVFSSFSYIATHRLPHAEEHYELSTFESCRTFRRLGLEGIDNEYRPRRDSVRIGWEIFSYDFHHFIRATPKCLSLLNICKFARRQGEECWLKLGPIAQTVWFNSKARTVNFRQPRVFNTSSLSWSGETRNLEQLWSHGSFWSQLLASRFPSIPKRARFGNESFFNHRLHKNNTENSKTLITFTSLNDAADGKIGCCVRGNAETTEVGDDQELNGRGDIGEDILVQTNQTINAPR